jgi:hypothetical protein
MPAATGHGDRRAWRVLGEIADALEVGGDADRADDLAQVRAIGWRLAIIRIALSLDLALEASMMVSPEITRWASAVSRA